MAPPDPLDEVRHPAQVLGSPGHGQRRLGQANGPRRGGQRGERAATGAVDRVGVAVDRDLRTQQDLPGDRAVRSGEVDPEDQLVDLVRCDPGTTQCGNDDGRGQLGEGRLPKRAAEPPERAPGEPEDGDPVSRLGAPSGPCLGRGGLAALCKLVVDGRSLYFMAGDARGRTEGGRRWPRSTRATDRRERCRLPTRWGVGSRSPRTAVPG